MRLVRGGATEPAADRAVTAALADDVRATDEPAVRVWRPPRQVAFGPRDARDPGYERARTVAREHGYPPVERAVGGRAVAYTGETVAFARQVPVADERSGIQERYERTTAALREALAALGADVRRGEPDAAWCPGTHSLSTDRGKVVGLAQRVTDGVATLGGCVVVADHAAVAAVLAPVYDALGLALDPATVGSVTGAGGPAAPDRVADAVAEALAPAPDRVELVGDAGADLGETTRG